MQCSAAIADGVSVWVLVFNQWVSSASSSSGISSRRLSLPPRHKLAPPPVSSVALDVTGPASRAPRAPPAATAAARQAGDDDVEEGDNAVDDSGQDGADAVDDRHQHGADCLEDSFDA